MDWNVRKYLADTELPPLCVCVFFSCLEASRGAYGYWLASFYCVPEETHVFTELYVPTYIP